MSTQQIEELLALPLEDRVDLAQALWESINAEQGGMDLEREDAVVTLAQKRDRELASGAVAERPHSEVVASIRRRLGCG